LSHGRRLVPTLAAHFDPYTDYPLPGAPGVGVQPGAGRSRNTDGDWMSVLRKTLVATGDRRGIGSGGGPSAPSSPAAAAERKEAGALCRGGRLIALNISAAEHAPVFRRILVPYPAAGQWFLTVMTSCSNVNIRRGRQETYIIHFFSYKTINNQIFDSYFSLQNIRDNVLYSQQDSLGFRYLLRYVRDGRMWQVRPVLPVLLWGQHVLYLLLLRR